MKSQAAQLAERDAMINVLQKHSSLGGGSRTSSVTSLLSSSPQYSPLPTLSSPLPPSLSSFITSTVAASIMSLSHSLPSSPGTPSSPGVGSPPGTGSPHSPGAGSPQSSILSDSSYREAAQHTHTKSSKSSANLPS